MQSECFSFPFSLVIDSLSPRLPVGNKCGRRRRRKASGTLVSLHFVLRRRIDPTSAHTPGTTNQHVHTKPSSSYCHSASIRHPENQPATLSDSADTHRPSSSESLYHYCKDSVLFGYRVFSFLWHMRALCSFPTNIFLLCFFQAD